MLKYLRPWNIFHKNPDFSLTRHVIYICAMISLSHVKLSERVLSSASSCRLLLKQSDANRNENLDYKFKEGQKNED